MPTNREPLQGTFPSMKGNSEEAFEDILEERRQSSDLRHAIKSFTPVIYKDLTPCNPSVLKTMTLESDELKYVMKQISLESEEPLEIIQEQASKILDEMAHTFRLGALRILAFSISKILKQLFQKVFVNVDGLQRSKTPDKATPSISKSSSSGSKSQKKNRRCPMCETKLSDSYKKPLCQSCTDKVVNRKQESDLMEMMKELRNQISTSALGQKLPVGSGSQVTFSQPATGPFDSSLLVGHMDLYNNWGLEEELRFYSIWWSRFALCWRDSEVSSLAKAIRDYPVVLLPSHRSYIDFLLVSYILFCYDLAVPVIAAGEDLSRMKIIGQLFRSCGAFYMKRTFKGNKLYSAIFAEYVKTMIRIGHAPIEFFIEGTRSRTGKTLHPRFGLLNIVMEPFFKGEVFDLNLIPISISYERIVEEAIYVQELLGTPKPKETTSGLLRARKLLDDNCGNVYIHFGEPLSLRSLASGKINRSQFNLIPRHLPYHPSKDIQKFVSDVGYKVELCQIAHMVISCGALIAAILLQNLPAINYSLLAEKTLWLKDLTEGFGGCVNWPSNTPVDEVLQASLELHCNFLNLLGGQVVLLEHSGHEIITEELVTKRAVTFLLASSYRNQIVNIYKQPALVVLASKMATSFDKEAVYELFKFLRCLLIKEFILLPGCEEQDFDVGCSMLGKDNLQITSNELRLADTNMNHFLFQLLLPFLECYQLACKYLTQAEMFTEKQFTSGMKSYVSQLIASGASHCYDALSYDLLRNSLASFVQLGIVETRISGNYIFLDFAEGPGQVSNQSTCPKHQQVKAG
ncbi:dihydroxyacetone phosphate acyltransferase-like [Gastrophryne carolinensis]